MTDRCPCCDLGHETLAEYLLPEALNLACTVRTKDPDAIGEALAEVQPSHHGALAVVLAALVNVDQPTQQLLGWLPGPGTVKEKDRDLIRQLREAWSQDLLRLAHNAFARGVRVSLVVYGEWEYQRRRKAQQRIGAA